MDKHSRAYVKFCHIVNTTKSNLRISQPPSKQYVVPKINVVNKSNYSMFVHINDDIH